jgi:hypothetical protein
MFNTQLKQTIDVAVEETTKEKMIAEIKGFNLNGVKTDIKRSKNAEKIIETNKNITETEKLKPKNCNCGVEANTTPLNTK